MNSEPFNRGPSVLGATGTADVSRETQELARSLGQALNTATFYGIKHKMTGQVLTAAFVCLERLLKTTQSLSFVLMEGDLFIGNQPVDMKNALVSGFTHRMEALNIEHFDITQGVSVDELAHLASTLGMNPERVKGLGGFAQVLASHNVTCIKASFSSFQKVSENDIVLKKNDLLQGLSEAAGSGAQPQALEQIVAFLKGDTGGPEEKNISRTTEPSPAEDAGKLADLILKAAEIAQQQAAVDGGESLADLVVGCLRREAQKIMDPAVMQTAKGRKTAARTLMLLEQNVLERLRAMAAPHGEAAMSACEEICGAVSAEVEELREDLAVESLVEEFAKKQKAAELAGRKISRYLKRHAEDGGAEALQEKLAAEGVSPAKWKKMQVSATPEKKDGEGGTGTGGGGGSEGVQMLALLLAELDRQLADTGMDGSSERRQKIDMAVKKIDRQAAEVADGAEKHLDDLNGVVGALAKAAETAEQQQQKEMSRRRLLELLAEITQEIFQPLSVVRGTNEMLLKGVLGTIAEDQAAMLKLSETSLGRMQHLAERLRDICGNPKGRSPDARVLDSIYQAL